MVTVAGVDHLAFTVTDLDVSELTAAGDLTPATIAAFVSERLSPDLAVR